MKSRPIVRREVPLGWQLPVLLLVALSVLGPLLFGLPVIGHLNGFDSNFALDLTHGYMAALRAGQPFPRWLPASNAGMGSPVFYFYGRLPFLVAALLGLGLHLGPVGALLGAFACFRTLAFFTCRNWLRRRASRQAADCGALFFLVVPYAMSLNPLTRVGLAETAATAFLPLLFLHLENLMSGQAGRPRSVAWLGLSYAAVACCHLPQLVLALAVAALYTLLRRSLSGFVSNLLGLALGVLVAAPSVLPALLLRSSISAAGWSENNLLQLRNNFLFTTARLYFYGLYAIDMELYATWLLCLLVLLAYLFSQRSSQAEKGASPPHTAHGPALAATLAVLLFAVTGLARPAWLLFPSLQAVQFPWRLFPNALVLGAALVALWAAAVRRRQHACLALCSVLVFAQIGVETLGAAVSFAWLPLHFAHRPVISYRLPVFVSPAHRERPAYARRRSFVPEYIPAAADRAGWQLSPDEQFLLPGPLVPSIEALNADVHTAPQADGTLHLTADLPSAKTVSLPLFFYPDETVAGRPDLTLRPAPGTGLASLELPAGPTSLVVTHSLELAPVRWGHRACVVGLLLLAACAAFGRKSESGT